MNETTKTKEALVCRNLVKAYGGVEVVRDFSLTVTPGQVLGLVGENGAGKSTTSGMITGSVQPDSGEMTLGQEVYAPKTPSEALRAGVALIHQEIRMLPLLSVAENIFLGRLPRRRGIVDRRLMNDVSADALRKLGSRVDPRRPVAGLPIAVQQEIEIARAITRKPKFIIFDEPSASLGESEAERVFEQIDTLRNDGTGIIYISHKLEEVTRVSDSIVCLRDGSLAGTWDTGDVPRAEIVRAMVGRDFVYGHEDPPPIRDRTVLEVKDLGREGAFQGVSFSVKEGEILGIAGLVGAGRTEVVRCIAGADKATTGSINVDGEDRAIRNPKSGIAAGVALVPEDRKSQGLILGQTGAENMTLPWESKLKRKGIITNGILRSVSEEQVKFLDIRGNVDIPVRYLSGGNQQKVLVGKWLIQKPKILILDEPTRGVDVGAKMTIYETIRKLALEGVAIIVVSSELEEVLGLSHRVLVMAEGRQSGVLTRADATPEAVMELAIAEESPQAMTPQDGDSDTSREESRS